MFYLPSNQNILAIQKIILYMSTREILQNTEDDFLFLIKNNQNLSTKTLKIPDEYPGKNIDFIFSHDKLSKTFIKIYSKENIYFPQDKFSLEEFLRKKSSGNCKKL